LKRKTIIDYFPFYYGWVIVGVSLIIMLIAYGVWWSFPVFYIAILDAFGWTRAQTAAIFTVGSVVYGISSIAAGILVDRFGPRKTIPLAGVIIAMGCIISAYSHQIWHFFISYAVFMGFGTVTAGFVPNAAVLSNWFINQRGTAIGIASVGEGASPLLAMVTQQLISHMGWRSSYLALAAAILLIIVPLSALFMRSTPESVGLAPDRKLKSDGPTPNSPKVETYGLEIVDKKWVEHDWTLLRGMRTYRFWLLLGSMFTLGMGMGILLTHQVALTKDIGFTETTAAFIFALTGLVAATARFGGVLADRVGREITTTIAISIGTIGIVALLLLSNPNQTWLLYVYAIAFGFGLGLFAPAYSCTVADLFIGKGFGAILGFINIGWGVGSGIGAWIGGAVFDRTGHYDMALLIGIIAFSLVCLFIWLAAPRKIRRVVKRSSS
jgi:MFS family permease